MVLGGIVTCALKRHLGDTTSDAGKPLTPDEMVGTLLLLCSEAGISGQVFNVDGGWMIRH